MWLINKLKASFDDPVELATEQLVLAEISDCEYCARIHRLTKMIPVICNREDIIRDYERAEMEVMARQET